jgi:hypothetical protein
MRDIWFRLLKDDEIIGFEIHHLVNRDVPGQGGLFVSYVDIDYYDTDGGLSDYIDHNDKEQFTGWKDKNNVRLYVGDLVRGSGTTGHGGKSTRYKELLYQVIYSDEMSGYCLEPLGDHGPYRFIPVPRVCWKVGNVHYNLGLIASVEK